MVVCAQQDLSLGKSGKKLQKSGRFQSPESGRGRSTPGVRGGVG